MGIYTVFDREETMKPCNIDSQGTCRKNFSMGPCRMPIPNLGVVKEGQVNIIIHGNKPILSETIVVAATKSVT